MVVDIVFVVLIALLVIRCATRGFIKELVSTVGLILGFLAALLLYSSGGAFIREKVSSLNMPIVPEILAFIALFLIVFIIIKIIGAILKGIIEGIHLGGADKFLGIVLGLVEGLIVVTLVIFVINIQPLFDAQKFLQGSKFAEILLPIFNGGSSGTDEFARLQAVFFRMI
jgi:membrane protein required for colicin V production